MIVDAVLVSNQRDRRATAKVLEFILIASPSLTITSRNFAKKASNKLNAFARISPYMDQNKLVPVSFNTVL